MSRRARSTAAWIGLGVAAGLLAVAPSGATAAVTCNFAAATAAIDASSAGNTATVGRSVSLPLDGIEVNGSQCGGSATVANTDTIAFTDSSGSNTTFIVGPANGPLAPGLTDESGGSDEVELTASFGSGGFEFDVLEVLGCNAAPPCATANDHVVWGSGGVNLNADEAPLVDADLTASGVEVYKAIGGAGNDTLAADGGFGTGIAALVPVQLFGFEGMDFLTGGTLNDTLDGGLDNDVLVGGTGDDNIGPGPGDDQLDGGGGAFDVANFSLAANGVSVDLANPGAQDTGEGSDLILNMESLFGSNFDDALLSGTNAPNNIQGSDGDDTIAGLDGDDSLAGGNGKDTIDGGADDGVVGDAISGGDGKDTADYGTATAVTVSLAKSGSQETGGAGVDTLTDVESVAGSPFADILKGDSGANVLKGRGAKDKLRGAKGKDTLSGGGGADVLLARDGIRDKVRCGKGHDVAKADAMDKLRGCEEKHVAAASRREAAGPEKRGLCPHALCLFEDPAGAGEHVDVIKTGVSNRLAKLMNNQASSVFNDRTGTALLYDKRNGKGAHFCLETGEASSNMADINFDDMATSTRLTHRNHCPH